MRRVFKCPCGHIGCRNWMMEPEAAIQGAGFKSEETAKAVAVFLEWREDQKEFSNVRKLAIDLRKCANEGTPSQSILMELAAKLIEKALING